MSASIRFATISDAEVLLKWRNDEYVRQFSKSTDLITEETHLVWFNNRLNHLNGEPLFIFEVDREPAGTARLDYSPEHERVYEISILIDPRFQGFGYAKVLLAQVCDHATAELTAVKLVAFVHRQNMKSRNLFQSAGFDLVKRDRIFLEYYKNLEL